MARIEISWSGGRVTAVLDDTPTARKLVDVLPYQSMANTWGEEVYFGLPITTRLEAGARQVVEPGTVCYWVEGRSLALPFGPTPISEGKECRLVSRVNILGHLECDPRILRSVADGHAISVRAVK